MSNRQPVEETPRNKIIGFLVGTVVGGLVALAAFAAGASVIVTFALVALAIFGVLFVGQRSGLLKL